MTMLFGPILTGLALFMRWCAWRDPAYRASLARHDYVAQIGLRDSDRGRWFAFRMGKLTSCAGRHRCPDVTVSYETAAQAATLMIGQLFGRQQTEAAKLFRLRVEGPDALAYAFTQALIAMQRIGWRFGTRLGDGATRFTGMTNGGPCFVHVKDGRILRMTPIDFASGDAGPWTIAARGRRFTPPHRATIAPHGLASKSLVYSPDRLLHPMRRVDFDPNGARNPENRGKSEYVRISWDEALDLVTAEIKRMKRDYGASAIVFDPPGHHSWGNVGWWDSALYRFANAVGYTAVHNYPASFEGWFWGAAHHWGYTMRLGMPENYGTVEDLLQHAELVVFWSSDPETTNGLYAGHEGSVRRQWLKELGIPTVHIDPYLNATAGFMGGKWIAPRPGTDTALALAIAHVWITEKLYDQAFVAGRTTGFATWSRYILGEEDGIARTPEWQQGETGVPAREVRALAREWGRKRTYLAAGGLGSGLGGACRSPTGHQWARAMVCLAAMQGLGRPGVNFGNLQAGTPIDTSFYFPGYGEGGISGDLTNTGAAVSLYQRMGHLLSMNPVLQQIPRLQLPEAILTGKAEGYLRDMRSLQGQFAPLRYPAPGHAPVRMYYRYGGSGFGTMPSSHRLAAMYRSPNLEFVVNQSIWFEGEAKFADVILPACTNFERHDISEWCGAAGVTHHCQNQLNHRVIVFQHKCIEPLGESKADYDIFLALAQRLGLGNYYSEGMTDLDWVRRIFDASDLAKHVGWKEFIRKGYYVVPPPAERLRAPVAFRWFYDGRKKDVPEPHPLPAGYAGEWGVGLQTASGKFEFEAASLKHLEPPDPERPPVLHFIRSREDTSTPRAREFPLQLVIPHPRFSFHTHVDGKDSFVNQIEEHRLAIGGRFWWVLRMNPADAARRGIRNGALVRVFNERGAVICAAQVTPRLRPGVMHSCEASARYEPGGESGHAVDLGGALNVLTPKQSQVARGHSVGNSNCLVEVELWAGAAAAAAETAHETVPAK